MNSLGTQFKVISFGESHGSHVGCLIEGCPAGLKIDLSKVQKQVDKRKTNQTEFASARNEADQIEIISGLFEGVTLGSPITILIKNKDANSKDYDELKDVFRPSHADFTNQMKYGIRDYRGGGRSSIRITAPMVAAGEIALQLINHFSKINVQAFVSKIGDVAIPLSSIKQYSQSDIESSSVRCPDKNTSDSMEKLISKTNEEGDTLGGIISCEILGLPVGIGEPVFGKLQAQLAHAMLSINTVKGFEFGEGFENASLKGSESNDSFIYENEKIRTSTNRSGGIQGGISNGEKIYFNVAFKPISSIQQTQKTVNQSLENISIEIKGRHDVCAVPRAIPIVEAYTQIVLADLFLQSKLSKI